MKSFVDHSMSGLVQILVVLLMLVSCKVSKEATTYDFPKPVDTTSKSITEQIKKEYATASGLSADNRFNGARLNDFIQINDSLFEAKIAPENSPINNSAWYAFKLWSTTVKKSEVRLVYQNGKHRYHPKWSRDGKTWSLLDSNRLVFDVDSINVTLMLETDQDTLWIAAQEIEDSKRGQAWCERMAASPYVELKSIGQSPGGRNINFMKIGNGKKAIVIFSRQHPPEVTGYYAMQAFISGVLSSDLSQDFFEEYTFLVYPMINPDGVDMGHWRHNSGGVDLNRDWAYYHQPETKMIANHVVNQLQRLKGEVVLGLDFHSTAHDVYYTLDKTEIQSPTIPWFREQWFAGLEKEIEGYKANERPAGIGAPVTKGWFYTQFGAEGITYEIGDATPREDIKTTGRVSAEELMKILINKKY